MVLYDRWDSEPAVCEAICEQMRVRSGEEQRQQVDLFVKTILYRINVQMIPQFKPLLVEHM